MTEEQQRKALLETVGFGIIDAVTERPVCTVSDLFHVFNSKDSATAHLLDYNHEMMSRARFADLDLLTIVTVLYSGQPLALERDVCAKVSCTMPHIDILPVSFELAPPKTLDLFKVVQIRVPPSAVKKVQAFVANMQQMAGEVLSANRAAN